MKSKDALKQLGLICRIVIAGFCVQACATVGPATDAAVPATSLKDSEFLKVLAAPPSGRADNDANELAEAVAGTLGSWLPYQMTEREVPGVAVAIVGRHEVFWEEVLGTIDAGGSAPITPETVFNIRSISKSITALAVLMAVRDGLLDLDTPISEYLPELKLRSRYDEHPAALITLRHMLSHWAGFTHEPPAGLALEPPGYFERYIERILDSWLRFPVGYRYQYANYGVDLAGYIIQVRSKKPFSLYVREKVLEPLGMSNSTFDLERIQQVEDRAIGHDTKGRAVPVRLPEIPAAGLYASIRDMSRYAQFHLNGGVVNGRRLLPEELMAEYHSIQFAHTDQRTGYTLGLIREPIGHTYSLYHEGGGRGFGAHFIVYPELDLGIVMLTNKEYHGLSGFEGRSFTNGPIINHIGPIPVAAAETQRMRRLETDSPEVAANLGRFGDSPGMTIGFESSVLGLRLNENTFAPLTMYDDGGEIVGMYGATSEVRFLPAIGGHPGSLMSVNRVYGNSNFHYSDYNDSPDDVEGPADPRWQQYIGDYNVIWADEANWAISITINNGYLYFNDGKCIETEPGLFFRYDGEVLDFRFDPPTYANQELRRVLSE